MTNKNLIYIVVDIEADGPAPGFNSMLSLAAVATSSEVKMGTFYRKLLPLEGAEPDPDTEQWWHKHPEALREVNSNQQPATEVMRDFVEWVQTMSAEPIFVSNPIALDYAFVSWYLNNLAGINPFIIDNNAIRTLDLRSYIAGKFELDYPASTKRFFPDKLTEGMPEHTHNALDDARGYAVLLRTLLCWGDKSNPYLDDNAKLNGSGDKT